MKRICLLIFLLSVTISYSQITRSKVLSLFKKDRYNNSKVLRTCNTDSLFFKADTLHFYANDYYSVKGCCQYVEWNFYDRVNFNERRTEECNEPPLAYVATLKDFYSIKVEKINKSFFINKYQNDKLIESYQVINIDNVYRNDDLVNRVTFVRQQRKK